MLHVGACGLDEKADHQWGRKVLQKRVKNVEIGR